jgi:hypothetical protein
MGFQAKEIISGPSAKRSKDLLKRNRDQLRWIVGLFIGLCHLKEHLFELGLTDDPICERCLEEDESATHALCSPFTVSSPGPVYYGAGRLLWRPHKQGPAVHLKCGIDKGLIQRGSTIDQWWSRCRDRMRPAPHTYIYTMYIHTYIRSSVRFIY